MKLKRMLLNFLGIKNSNNNNNYSNVFEIEISENNTDDYYTYIYKINENFLKLKNSLEIKDYNRFEKEILSIDCYLFLKYLKDRIVFEKKIPSWLYIERQNLFDICIELDYIEESLATEYDILFFKYTIKDLKQILKINNLKISGNKPNLINRIIENKVIEFEKTYKYSITKKGLAHLEEYSFVDCIENHTDKINYIMYAAFENTFPNGFLKRDVLWSLFNYYNVNHIMEDYKVRYYMFKFLKQEKNNERTLIFALLHLYSFLLLCYDFNLTIDDEVYIDQDVLDFIFENSEIYKEKKNLFFNEIIKFYGEKDYFQFNEFDKIIQTIITRNKFISFTKNYSFMEFWKK